MPESILKNAFVSIAGVDLSDHVRTVGWPLGVERQDDTVMGDNARSFVGGLETWTLTVEFNQDYASSKVDATLGPVIGTVVAVILRPDTGAKSATNPEWTGNGLIADYTPVAGSVGDVAIATVEIIQAGSLTRGV